jgi:hypothetical protein
MPAPPDDGPRAGAAGSGRPLVPDDAVADRTGTLVYDDGGVRVADAPTDGDCHNGPSEPTSEQPCSLEALDGSWYVRLSPASEAAPEASRTHGVMRVESRSAERLRLSGDVYVAAADCADGRATQPRPENPLAIGDNWYPHFEHPKYSWYFRSGSASYRQGQVRCDLTQHVWNPTAGEFSGETNDGRLSFDCGASPVTRSWLPRPTLQLTGTVSVGGTTYDLVAYKTAPYYRGCLVEIDVMGDREWVGNEDGGRRRSRTFTGVYGDAGLEMAVVVDETDIEPEADLTLTELRQLLETHQSALPEDSDVWRLWVVVGSELKRYDTLGIMFDDTEPYREGVALFFDPPLPDTERVASSAQGERLGDVPLAFLRTALHEVGHGFNLFHPKADQHAVPVGTTLMNQTSDLLAAASPTTPFPDVASFAFHEHNRTSLVHSPDPQVKPRWKRFGYGHGEQGAPPTPSSDLTHDRDTPVNRTLDFDLELPETVTPGELPLAALSVHNPTDEPQEVTAALNLAEDYLAFRVSTPDDRLVRPRSVIQFCTTRRTTTIAPQERLTGHVQLLYTSQGVTFDRPGTYSVRAELDLGTKRLESEARDVLSYSPRSDAELERSVLGVDDDVGRCIALGDARIGTPGEAKLRTLAETFADTDLGTAASIVLSNAYMQDTRDLRTNRVVSASDQGRSRYYLDCAVESISPAKVMRIATAVAPPGERSPPVLQTLLDRFDEADCVDDAETADARAVLLDFYAGTGDETHDC